MVTKLQRSDSIDRIAELLGPNASELLNHTSQTISKDHAATSRPGFCRPRLVDLGSLAGSPAFPAIAV